MTEIGQIIGQLDPAQMSKGELVEFVRVANEIKKRERQRLIDSYYPDEGPLRRELYVKHLEFFAAGAEYSERCIIAANRIGKSMGVGAYEMSLHLTGQYPGWWVGRRFNHGILAWAAGDTGKTVRDIVQLALLGETGDFGTGMIPADSIEGTTPKHGLPDAIESVKVRHVSGDISTCFLKSYDQRREAFQGTAIHVGWCDEEPPEDIYVEMLMRTMTTGGIIMVTFTPLLGVSNVVKSFMPGIGHDH